MITEILRDQIPNLHLNDNQPQFDEYSLQQKIWISQHSRQICNPVIAVYKVKCFKKNSPDIWLNMQQPLLVTCSENAKFYASTVTFSKI